MTTNQSSLSIAATTISDALPTLLPYTDPEAAAMQVEVVATMQAVTVAITALLAMYSLNTTSKNTQVGLLRSIQDAADELDGYVNSR